MAERPDSVNRVRAMLGLLAALALPLAACAPEVPAAPTYTKDVQPILAAHCVRCHGADDMLVAIPGITAVAAAPRLCYLQSYDNQPMGCVDGSAGCQSGAKFCAAMFPGRVNAADNTLGRMPPKPSEALSAWEQDVLLAWAKNNPPAP